MIVIPISLTIAAIAIALVICLSTDEKLIRKWIALTYIAIAAILILSVMTTALSVKQHKDRKNNYKEYVEFFRAAPVRAITKVTNSNGQNIIVFANSNNNITAYQVSDTFFCRINEEDVVTSVELYNDGYIMFEPKFK